MRLRKNLALARHGPRGHSRDETAQGGNAHADHDDLGLNPRNGRGAATTPRKYGEDPTQVVDLAA